MPARLTVLFVFVAIAGLAGQNQPPSGSSQPTFRSAANYVRVDMYATKDGQIVEDLKLEEIELLEDGAAQKIEAFEHIKIRPAGPQDTRIEPTSVTESRQMAADPRARVFVIFLDTYHTQIEGSANMRLPLVRFLDRVLGADDLVALMTPEMSATDLAFGRKTVVISNIMQAEWMWGRRGRANDQDPKEELYDACYGPNGRASELKARRREKLTLDALQDLIVHLGGLREERKAVLTVTEGWRLFREDKNLAASPEEQRVSPGDVLLRRPRRQPEDRGNLQGSNRIECETDRLALASVDHTLRLRDITDDANRANVTFYPVYARGLVSFDAPIGPERPPPPDQDAANLSARQDSLRFLADGTDGTAVINTNNIDARLRRIVDDLSSYYLLGYYSTNAKLDGRFRNITVRIKRPGVRVRARRGYRGATAEQLLSGSPRRGSSSSSNTAASPLDTSIAINNRASFRIRASSWGRPAGGTFWVVGELDYRTRKELAWTAGAKADVVVLGADGAEVLSRTLAVPAAEGSFALRVPESGEVPPGEYAVRIRLRSDADEQLSMSDTARVAVRSDGPAMGDAVMWRRGRATGPQYVRTADPRFQRSDRIRLELATAAVSAPTARMLDRAGRPLQVPVQISGRPSEEGDFRWIVADAALAPLAAGDYAIEVADGDAKQVTPFRVVP